MGAAGDMLTAALLELVPDPDAMLERLNNMGLEGVRVRRERTVKLGIEGTRVCVEWRGEVEHAGEVHESHESLNQAHTHTHGGGDETHAHTHEHGSDYDSGLRTLQSVNDIIDRLNLPASVRGDAKGVYAIAAEAESQVHGLPIAELHFHELGMYDAIADIAGFCLLVHELKPDYISASPINVGSGTVRTSHGVLPVPAPATSYILTGVPTYSGVVRAELCTPTGAALLKYFVREFERQPLMTTEKIGYGMGTKDFEVVNCVRAFWGNQRSASDTAPNGSVTELCCNLDDMTGEDIGFAAEELMRLGALDVYLVPIQMKKFRPGTMLCCLCPEARADEFASHVLRLTSSFGVRRHDFSRYELERESRGVRSRYGTVRVKSGRGYGSIKSKPEYEDLARIARRRRGSTHATRRSVAKVWVKPF